MRYLLIVITIIVIISAVLLYNSSKNSTKSTNAEVVEFTDDPDDSEHPLSKEELDDISTQYMTNSIVYDSGAIRNYSNIAYDVNKYEYLGGHGGGRGGGGRGGGGRGGGGRGGGGRGWGAGWGRRPWRSSYWRTYPHYYNPYGDYSYYYNSSYYPDYASGYSYVESKPVNRFSVRIMDKQASHPYNGRGFPKGFSIIGSGGGNCGISGASLTLQRGVTYEFDIFTSRDCLTGESLNEPFFFTTDPAGGRDSGRVFNVKPIVNGVLKITPDASTPSRFFYNSSRGSFVGGNVVVV